MSEIGTGLQNATSIRTAVGRAGYAFVEASDMRNALARKARLGLNGLAMWLHDYIAMHLRSAPEKRECLRTLQRSTLQWPPFYT